MGSVQLHKTFNELERGLTSTEALSDEPVKSAPEAREGEMDGKHEHVDCPPDQRKWLERRLDLAATMRPHAYCVTCGKVKNLDGPRARKLGFYLSGLSALKEYMERNTKYGKMTQSQSRLISKALEGLEEFEDLYGLNVEIQTLLFMEAVKRVRPDLDDELVLRLLPKIRRKFRRPLIETMARALAG